MTIGCLIMLLNSSASFAQNFKQSESGVITALGVKPDTSVENLTGFSAEPEMKAYWKSHKVVWKFPNNTVVASFCENRSGKSFTMLDGQMSFHPLTNFSTCIYGPVKKSEAKVGAKVSFYIEINSGKSVVATTTLTDPHWKDPELAALKKRR